jgi:hypothetical protein
MDAEIFRNRKGWFSFNVQTISSHDLRITDIVARYPGSSHDSFIFKNSKINERFQAGEFKKGILLGDGGYGLQPYLMTPLRDPITNAEKLYNESHIRTRNTVERQYGVWKRRFPCLSLGMRFKLETQAIVIIATAILHNFCIKQKDVFITDENIINEQGVDTDTSNQTPVQVVSLRQAKVKQKHYINYFETSRN